MFLHIGLISLKIKILLSYLIMNNEYGYILHYIEIALCILRLHLELAITFTNYNQMKHDISYEKYEISLKRNFLSMRNVLLPKQRITAYCIRKILKELFWEISLLKIFLWGKLKCSAVYTYKLLLVLCRKDPYQYIYLVIISITSSVLEWRCLV